MPTGVTLAIIVVSIVLATVLISEAVIRAVQAWRGVDLGAIDRRLSQASQQGDSAHPEIFQQIKKAPRLRDIFLPFYQALTQYLEQSGAPLSVGAFLIATIVMICVMIIMLWVILPGSIKAGALPLGILVGGGAMLFYVSRRRTERISTFEEQLPDAIELMVRSLRVGHPLSVAVAAVGQEMPAPIGEEFARAANKVTYGMTVPEAFREMQERVPIPDLGFLVVAFHIQAESGGNLVESLAKLANVIRDRFRMFRKVKSMTAEGRLSAWLLSCFPFGIGVAINILRPGYYDHVAELPYFNAIAVITVLSLIINIIVMVMITKIRV